MQTRRLVATALLSSSVTVGPIVATSTAPPAWASVPSSSATAHHASVEAVVPNKFCYWVFGHYTPTIDGWKWIKEHEECYNDYPNLH
jgi:hypothetical protein